ECAVQSRWERQLGHQPGQCIWPGQYDRGQHKRRDPRVRPRRPRASRMAWLRRRHRRLVALPQVQIQRKQVNARIVTVSGLVSFGALAVAQVDFMNQLDATGMTNADLVGTSGFGVNQRFGDAEGFGAFSGAVIDDFTVSSGVAVDEVSCAFETSNSSL